MGEGIRSTEGADTHTGAVVERHIHCIECGYDLFGLDPAGRCPECGTDIALSTRGELLKFANPQWLRRVKRGLMVMYYTLTLGFIVGIASGVIAGVAGNVGQDFINLLILGVGGLTVAAVYITTAEEPGDITPLASLRWRGPLRVLALVDLGAITLATFAGFVDLMPLVGVGGIAGPISALVVTFAYFSYIPFLAHRIPDAKLARASSSVKWGLTIANLLVLPTLLTAAVSLITGAAPTVPSGTGPTWSDLIHVLNIIGCLVYLIYLMRALRVLLRYRKAIKAALDEAGQALP